MMNNTYKWALEAVLKHEGGLVDDPNDLGGITNKGISIRFAGSIGLDLDGDGDTDAADIRAITVEDVTEIYLDHFWNPCRCGELHPALAICVFDSAVNQGVGAAVRMLQGVVKAFQDGKFGPKTMQAVQARQHSGLCVLIEQFMARRVQRYANTSKFNLYGYGWLRRTFSTFRTATTKL